MAALTASQLLDAGVIFGGALAIFLGGCAVSHFITEPSDDEADRAIGLGGADISLPDELRRHAAGPNPDHFESLIHARSFRTKEQ